MNKKIWLGIYLLSFGAFLLAAFAVGVMWLVYADQTLRISEGTLTVVSVIGALFYLQFVVISTIYNFAILAKMWGAVQDGVNPITVGKAIGFLFIPFFSVYWIFRAWGSYPTEYNNYLDRHGLSAPRLSGGAFTLFPLLMLLTAIFIIPLLVLPFVFAVVVARVADSVNNLEISKQHASQGVMPGSNGAPEFAAAGTSRRVLALGGAAALLAFVGLAAFGVLAKVNSSPTPGADDLPQTVGGFVRKAQIYSTGSIFGLGKLFSADYEAPAGGGKKTVDYTLKRFLFESLAADKKNQWFYRCNGEASRKESQVKNVAGEIVGELVVCSEGLSLRNGKYFVTLEPAFDYSAKQGVAVPLSPEDMIEFVKALPFNSGISIADLASPAPKGVATTTTPKDDSTVASPSGQADFTITAEEFYKETNGTNSSGAVARYKNKTVEISGRYYPLGTYDGKRITLHAGDSAISAEVKTDGAGQFTELKGDDRIKIRCRADGDYGIWLKDCVLVEARGAISVDDKPDYTFTAAEYYNLVGNSDIGIERMMENQKVYRGKLVKVTGPIKIISGDAHHLSVGGLKWVTCEPDEENEGSFTNFAEGQQVTLMGVGGISSGLDHCIVISG